MSRQPGAVVATRDRPLPPLVGRAAELEGLSGLLDEAAAGSGRMLFLEGEAGVGKTRLVTEATAAARRRGFHVLTAEANELQAARPFGLVADALGVRADSTDPRRRSIAALLAPRAEVASEEPHGTAGLTARITEALVALAEDLSTHTPLLVVLENLHWADPASIRSLAAVGRRLFDRPIALVGTFRPVPSVRELDRLLDVLHEATHRVLGPLDPEAVREVAAWSAGGRPAPSLLSQVSACGGNPFYVIELVEALREDGALESNHDMVESVRGSSPPNLTLTIVRRLTVLHGPTLQVLRLASILGSWFTIADLAAVSGQATAGLLPALEEALLAGVLGEEDAGRLAFRHDLVRQALYDDIAAPVRSALHRDAASALAASGAAAAQVAAHLVLADPPQAEDVEPLLAAAHETAPTAPGTAVPFLLRVLDILPPDAAERQRLTVELLRHLVFSGQLAEGERLARQILEDTPDPEVDLEARLYLVRALLAGGRNVEALGLLESRLADRALPDPDRARLLAETALAGSLAGRGSADVELWAADALALAGQVDDHAASTVALNARCVTANLSGRLADAVALAREAVEHADRSPGLAAHEHYPHLFLGLALLDVDAFEEADGAFLAGRRFAEEPGHAWDLPAYDWGSALRRYRSGDWDDAVAHAETGIGFGDEVESRGGRVFALSLLALLALHRDRLQDVEDHLQAAEQNFAQTGPQYLADWLGWVRALQLEALGRPEEAAATLGGVWNLCAGLGIVSEFRTLGPDLVRLSLATGDVERADATAAEVERLAALARVSSLQGVALRCRGLVAGDPQALRDAVEAYRASPRPVERALACEDAAVALGRSGRSEEAATLFAEALAILEPIGAVRDTRRIGAAMRAVGLRRPGPRSRGRPASGWESLTPAERAVIGLVAEGLTNRQIADRLYLSRYTIETHLKHVYAKLGIGSRTRLAAAVAGGALKAAPTDT